MWQQAPLLGGVAIVARGSTGIPARMRERGCFGRQLIAMHVDVQLHALLFSKGYYSQASQLLAPLLKSTTSPLLQ